MATKTKKAPQAAAAKSAHVDKLFAEAPAHAFALEMTAPTTFADVAAGDGDGRLVRGKISMLARTAGAIDHWYWGPIVHDFAGMKRRDRIAVDYVHDDYELIGYLDQFVADQRGLNTAGELISVKAGDRAEEVLLKGKAGIPFEASIDWSGAARIEEVPHGMTAEANGQTFAGPCLIVREWSLRRVAVCPSGADGGTSTAFSKQRGDRSAQVFRKEEIMGDENQGDNAPDLANVKKQAADDARAELKRFCEAFGDADGAKFFNEGLQFGDALAKHAAKLAEQNKELSQKLADTEKKLSETKLGETEAASGADGDKAKGGKAKFASVFHGAALKQKAAAN